MLFVKNKEENFRMCIDYRQSNKMIVENKYQLPEKDDLFDQIGREKYFSKIDLQ